MEPVEGMEWNGMALEVSLCPVLSVGMAGFSRE